MPPDGAPDGTPDAPPDVPPDAPPVEPGPLERIDWRTMRGARFLTTAHDLPRSELFALSQDGYVTRSGCVQGCNYAWRDVDGVSHTERANLLAVTATTVSADGRRASLVALDELENCAAEDFTTPVARGTLQLLDLASGASSFDLPLRTNLWGAPAFTGHDDWFFAAPNKGKECIGVLGLRAARAPFGPAPGLDADLQFADAIDAQRWLAFRNADLGVVDPAVPGSYRFLADDPSRFDVSRGWAHVYVGFGLLAQEVLSLPPSGAMHQTTLRDEDWFPFGVLGRWVRVCRILQPEGFRDCRVVDAQGQAAPVNFRVTITPDHRDDAVLLVDGAVVYVGPLADGTRAVQRVRFATGEHEVLHAGNGTLRSLGDGAAALLVQGDAVRLIEATRDELVADHVRQVISVPARVPVPGRRPARQDDVAALVLAPDAASTTLALLDVRTRRLATVTDHLFFTPPPGGGFAFDDGCGQPWTARNGGTMRDGLFQQGQQLFFVEQGEPATVWLVPIDLSSPPRRLADLTGSPVFCHAPLASPDGSRAAIAEDSSDGTTVRITVSGQK